MICCFGAVVALLRLKLTNNGMNIMKKSLIALIVSAPLVLGLSGCVIAIDGDNDDYHLSSHDRATNNRQHIATLLPQMSISDVTTRFGIADFNESYNKDGENINVLFYRTHRVHKDDLTTKDECTALIFTGGALVSWDEQAVTPL